MPLHIRTALVAAAVAGAAAFPAIAPGHGVPAGPAQPAQAPAPVPPGCPATPDPATVASVERLMADNRKMASYGQRPTASPAHQEFVAWTEQRLRAIAGMQVGSVGYGVSRWLERSHKLEAAGKEGALRSIRVSGAVPYSKATAGVTAALLEVPAGTAIADADVAGKVVVRDAATATVPNAVFTALEWWSYDPGLELVPTIAGNYERDYLAYEQRMADLREAAAKGAAALIFVHDFPHEQVAGHYAPYEGEAWKLPALYVGADEGAELSKLAAGGGRARVRLDADEREAGTKTLVGVLPGASSERIVVTSHTDGMNAVWDNGPISMLAIAEHLASLPAECRPRTIQFVFTTAHLFQQLNAPVRGGGSEELAADLDASYDEGTVAMALALEHMGAKGYTTAPRPGHPGRQIVATGINEPTSVFIGDSPALVSAMLLSTVRQGMTGSLALRGADLPGLRLPPHRNFGGEGGAYQGHLIPTVALVTGPWSLYNPAFGIDAVDGPLLRTQTLAFIDLLYSVGDLPRDVIGGAYLPYREARTQICASAFGTFGVVDCPGARKPVKGPPAESGARKCTSRRRFSIRLPRAPRGQQIRSARVTVGSRRVKARRGRRWTAVVDLRGRPARTVVVRIRVTTSTGRVLRQTRRYLPCRARKA